MHYVGMLAFRLPVTVLYDWPLTGKVTPVEAGVVETATVVLFALSVPAQPSCTGLTVYFQVPSGTPVSVHVIAVTVPAQAATSRLHGGTFALAAGFAVLLFAFTRWFWRFGLRRYSGASA